MTAVPALAPRVSSSIGAPRRRRAARALELLGPGPARGTWDESWLDGVRACAVLFVVVYHVWIRVGTPTVRLLGVDLTWFPTTMGFGVTIFFVLSGYLLARPWFVAERAGAASPRARTFWRRRLLRIVPAYYLSIAFVLVLFVPAHMIPREAVTGRTGVANLCGQLLFLQGYLPISSGNLNTVNGAWWTLSVEMTLYLLLPLLVPLFMRRRARNAVLVALAVTVSWTYLADRGLGGLVRAMASSIAGPTSEAISVPPTEAAMRVLVTTMFPAWAFMFALGIALARLSVAHEFRTMAGVPLEWWQERRTALVLIVTGSVGVLWSQYLTGTEALASEQSRILTVYLPRTVAPAALALIMWGLTVGGDRSRRALGWLPLRFVGWTSYGIYLFHLPLITFIVLHTHVLSLAPLSRFVVLLALAVVASVAAGAASWLLVERPLLRRRPAQQPLPAGAVEGPTGPTGLRRAGRWARHGRRPQLGLLVVATGMAAAVIVRTQPPPLDSISGGLFTGRIEGVRSDQSSIVRGSVSAAQEAGLMYPEETAALDQCGAGRGRLAVLVTEQWSVSAAVFPCRTRTAAAAALEALADWEPTIGYQRVGGGLHGARVWFRDTHPPTPTHPDQFHVRLVSGRWLVRLAIEARSKHAGQQAVGQLQESLAPRLRPQEGR